MEYTAVSGEVLMEYDISVLASYRDDTVSTVRAG